MIDVCLSNYWPILVSSMPARGGHTRTRYWCTQLRSLAKEIYSNKYSVRLDCPRGAKASTAHDATRGGVSVLLECFRK